RETHIEVKGTKEQTDIVNSLLSQLVVLMERGILIMQSDIQTAIKMAERGKTDFFSNLYDELIIKSYTVQVILAKYFVQAQYHESVKKKDIVFGIGPAGTGKTFLAVVMAVEALKSGKVKKIILTRPAVEAGENLGFLPGDLKEKVDPYLRPVY